MTKQAKQNKQTVEEVEAKVLTLEEQVLAKIYEAQQKDANIKAYKVTGYTTVKYGNKVLFELHLKKRSITHLTFAQTQKVFADLKAKKLIQRIVPKSYGWKYDTECLLTQELFDNFDSIFANILEEAIAERNLKQQKEDKKADKKVANA